jgi:hypothetical protein
LTLTDDAWGPIFGLLGKAEDPNNPGFFKAIVIQHRNAANTQNVETEVIRTVGSTFPYHNFRITNITEIGGSGCGNCGNPPIDIPPFPPEGDVINFNFTYVDNSDNSRNVDVNLRLFAPVFVTPVNIYAPVTVDFGGVQFNGQFEIAPEFNFEFGNPDSVDGPGSGVPAPPETPDQAPDTPEDSGQRRLIGVIVRADVVGDVRATVLFQNDAPDLYVPRLANLYIRVRVNNGLAWIGPIDVKQRSFYYAVPESVFAVTARTEFEPGFSGSVTLVWSDSQQFT